MCQVQDTNTFQRQHNHQTSVSQAQGPGSKGKEEWGHIQLPVWNHQPWRRIYRETSWALGECCREHLKNPSPIHVHSLYTNHQLSPDQFNIIGMEDQDLSRLIKESIHIRVNNPTLKRNIDTFNLSHIWDRVLSSTPDLKQPFPKGMCIYTHSYYISCSYVGLSLELKKFTVVDESLSVSNQCSVMRIHSTIIWKVNRMRNLFK